MLELLGSEYLIEHVVAEHNLRYEEMAFRNYVSDLLMLVVEGKVAEIQYRYADLVNRQEKEEEKTADEIVLEVIEKAGLKGSTHERNGTGSGSIA